MTSRFMLSAAPTSATWCHLSKSSESENRFDLNKTIVLKATFLMLLMLWFPIIPSVWAKTFGRTPVKEKRSEPTVRITTLMKPALSVPRSRSTSIKVFLLKILPSFTVQMLSLDYSKQSWRDEGFRSWFTADCDSLIELKLKMPWHTCAWPRTLPTIPHFWESLMCLHEE